MTDEGSRGDSPDSGLDGFVRARPFLSGFLTFLVIQSVAAGLGGLLGSITSSLDSTLPTFGVTAILNVAAYVVAGVWGFKLGGGRFLVGLLLPVGIVLLIIGACIALIITALSVSG